MDLLLAALLVVVGAACWIGGSYFGIRRASRAQTSQSAAERKAGQLEGQSSALLRQLEGEKLLFERFPDPVIVFGNARDILRANTAARTMLGAEAASLLRHPSFRNALDRAQQTGQNQSAEITLPVPTARELYLSVLPVDGHDAPRPRLLATLSDRTRERVVERMRADFVANASHELRTPLTSLIGFIDTLRGAAADDPAAQARFLGIMAEQGQRMNRLIDDLLSLSRIELTEHLQPAGYVRVGELVDRLVAEFAPLLETHRVTLALEIASGLPDVVGDEDQLAQVLQNLLENAIKYGKDGGRISLAVTRSARNGQDGIAIAVQDQGIGIAATDIPRLTERFYRVNTHRSRAAGGTGLGLAIVKHIVNRHRGTLKIESAQGAGTSVTVWLRVSDAPPGNSTAMVGFGT